MIVHEPRIASDVGNQFRRQSALDPDWLPFNHGCNPTTAILYDGSDGSTKSDLTGVRPDRRRLLDIRPAPEDIRY